MDPKNEYEWSRRFADELVSSAAEKAYAGDAETASAFAAAAQAHATLALAAATMAASEED